MKRIISFVLVCQIFFINAAKACDTESYPSKAHSDDLNQNISNDDGIKICCKDINGNEIYSTVRLGGIPAIGIIGIAAGGLLVLTEGSLWTYRKLHDMQYSTNIWSNIVSFNPNKILNSSEIQDFRLKHANEYDLLSKAIDTTSSRKIEDNNEKPVSFFIENQKAIIIKDSEMKSGTMHLYSFKLPDELAKKPLSLEATLVYNNSNNIGNNPDFHLFKNIRTDKLAKNIGKNHLKPSDEFNGKLKINELDQEKVSVVQKEFNIKNEFNKNKPVFLAVSCPDSPKKLNLKQYTGSYALFLKIKEEK